MTIKEIRGMFAPGQKWEAVNTLHEKANGVRTLVEIKSAQMVWSTATAPRFWMPIPKASQVVEARDGFLSFRLYTPDEVQKYLKPGSAEATVTLTRI
jgi:hypothetical protein